MSVLHANSLPQDVHVGDKAVTHRGRRPIVAVKQIAHITSHNPCHGCQLSGVSCAFSPPCLSAEVVWIFDTEDGRAQYVADALEQ